MFMPDPAANVEIQSEQDNNEPENLHWWERLSTSPHIPASPSEIRSLTSSPELSETTEDVEINKSNKETPQQLAEKYRSILMESPDDFEAYMSLASLIGHGKVIAIPTDYPDGIIPDNRADQMLKLIASHAPKYTEESSNSTSAELIEYPEEETPMSEVLLTHKDPSLFANLFSFPDIRRQTLSHSTFNTRKNMRLVNQNINQNLWQVLAEIRDQNKIIYAKRVVISNDSTATMYAPELFEEVQITFFVKRNGNLLIHLTDYKITMMREISLPNHEKVKHIWHKDHKSRSSDIISESGKMFAIGYQFETKNINDNSFIVVSTKYIYIKDEKPLQAVLIFGDGIPNNLILNESGQILVLDEDTKPVVPAKITLIPRSNNARIKQLCHSWLSSSEFNHNLVLALTEAGDIYTYKTNDLLKFMKNKSSKDIAPERYSLSADIKIKHLLSSSASRLLGVISKQGNLYELDIDTKELTLIELPNGEKADRGFETKYGYGVISHTGSLYNVTKEFKKIFDEETFLAVNDPSSPPIFIFTHIPLPPGEIIKHLDVSYDAATIVTESGSVLVFGKNDLGELGLDHKEVVASPQYLPYITDYQQEKLNEFYELLSATHLKWYNCWLRAEGDNFSRVISLLQNYLDQEPMHSLGRFSLSDPSNLQPSYSFKIQVLIGLCLTFSKEVHARTLQDNFNHFIEQLHKLIDLKMLDRKGELYALFEIIQLETQQPIFSNIVNQNNANTAHVEREKDEKVTELRPPR